VTHGWIGELRNKLDSPLDETSRTGHQRRLCMLAATCFSTFDVCPEHICTTFACEDDFSIAMQCAVIVHDNTLFDSEENAESRYLTRMLRRHRRLLHSLEPFFGQSFPPICRRTGLLHAEAYDDALAQLWVGYRPGNSSSWRILPKPNSRWISCVADGGKNIYYDMLTGELLIGGKRSGRLPHRMLNHSTYESIFGTVSGPNLCVLFLGLFLRF
jgi:hypothetical protein